MDINQDTGDITVKEMKKELYMLCVTLTDDGGINYESAVSYATIQVRVK